MSKQINLLDTLTEHESAVFDLIFAGAKRSEVAEKLSITESTVKYHLAHIYEKLNVRGRAEAVAYAVAVGKEAASVPQRSPDKVWSAEQIRAAASVLVRQGLADRKTVNAVVTDLLLALEEKL